ncbi:hypothetical protein ACP4OV_016589 [Aristida adscensionis]
MAGAGEAAAKTVVPSLVHDVGDDYFDPHRHYSIASRHRVYTTMDLLLDHRCLETPQGWVLALHRASPSNTFLWRPQDGHRIVLPPMDAADLPTNSRCLLTHKLSDEPGAADPCVVVVFHLASARYWFYRVRGGTQWQHRPYTLATLNSEGTPLLAWYVGIAAVGGKIYHQLSMHELGVLEFNPVEAEPTLTRIQVYKVRIPRGSPLFSSYLVESCGELFLVVVYFQTYFTIQTVDRVALYKMDFSKPAWRKVKHIGDRVFLLGGKRGSNFSNFGASCPASEHGLAADRIYFFNHIFNWANYLHVFNLTNRTEEVQCIFEGIEDVLGTPFWMLPTEVPYISRFQRFAKWFFTNGRRLLSFHTDFVTWPKLF